MEIAEAKKIKECIVGYNLFETLKNRLEIVVVGGVADSTIYKAFRVGGKTPLLRTILLTGAEVIEQHEQAIESALRAPDSATALATL